MWVKEEEAVALVSDKVVGGGWSTAASAGQNVLSTNLVVEATTYPAMPTDCGSRNDTLSASQYAGVTRSMPNRMPTSTRIGVNVPSVDVAKERSLSSYTSAPSPFM